ncbi:hypothetical protein EDB80DRAFT_774119 [Ilyonectria destructans]|nr:hypothetical protein EDB80DRAFT_774119 [Ilyonectria destructans]
MKFTFLVAVLVSGGMASPCGTCNDACARDLTQSGQSEEVVSQACAAFLDCVYTTAEPSTTFVTEFVSTAIVTVTAVPQQNVPFRRLIAEDDKVIPDFAGHCDSKNRFSTACSCAGYTAPTITVSPAMITSTITAVATVTSTVEPPNTYVACPNASNSALQCCTYIGNGGYTCVDRQFPASLATCDEHTQTIANLFQSFIRSF